MNKINFLLIFIIISCSYPEREKELESRFLAKISQNTEQRALTLDFNELQPDPQWDTLIFYQPFGPVARRYNYRINLFTKIEDIKQTDQYVVVGFLKDSKMKSYAYLERNPDLVQIIPPGKSNFTVGRRDAVFPLTGNR
jgi:hypothetical protein